VADPQIYVVEGIPGSGKDLTIARLREELGDRLYWTFDEGEVLCSWKHYWLENIDVLRAELMDGLLAQVQILLREEPDAVVLFNRFHISPILWNKTPSLALQHARIVARLRLLPTKVIVPMLERHEIQQRVEHPERREPAWRRHLRKRLQVTDFKDIGELYAADQQAIGRLLEDHALPYEVLHVDPRSGTVQREQPLSRFLAL